MEDKKVFYIDDTSPDRDQDYLPEDLQRFREIRGSYCQSSGKAGRTQSVSSQTELQPRKLRNSVDLGSNRRSSVHSARPRANSYARSTPLGDGRRASICKRGRPRSASTSTSRRKDSIRPTTRLQDFKLATKPIDIEIEPATVKSSPREIERDRRHHRVALIILSTFLFLLIASVLAVIVTLTHSSFYRPPVGSKELAEYRAQLRKENEELINSLNRDPTVPGNSTIPP